MRRNKAILASLLSLATFATLTGCSSEKEDDAIILRISNWEEYIDLGDWDEDELIDLEDGTEIIGENSMVEDFEEWYLETYGKKVRVEYSTFGTNEELYNQMTIGDVFDLVCPSEYMIMKLMREDKVIPFSDEFKNTEIEENYFSKGVSPFIYKRLSELEMNGNPLSDYAATYMWGTLGIVYNPEELAEEDVSSWKMFMNDDLSKRITIKDSVRDAYVAAVAIANYDMITDEDFIASENYYEKLSAALNATDVETVNKVEDILSDIKNRVYSFETDSGKADMVTGKVIANEQWSGDAVYTLDQADEDDVELCYSVPEEGSNLWFDGWIMLKDGIGEDKEKQQAAEAFINFVSMPENAIRNMYYIGYTSAIAGGDSDLIFQYMDWTYGAEEDDEDTVDYPVGYFFSSDEDADEEYCITTTEDQTRRQLFAQYPPLEVVDRCTIMACFPEEDNARINHMWTNIRCFDLGQLFK